MSLKKQAIKGVIWSGIQNWGSQAGSLITFLILARLLSPADFGLLALANTFVTFVSIFLDQGFSQALIQRHEIEDRHFNTAFWTQICLGVCFMLLGVASSHLIAAIFEQPRLAPILQVLSSIFVINSLNRVQLAILRRKLAFKAIAIRALASIIISGIVGVGFAFYGYGVWSLVAQQLTFEIVGVITFWSISDWKPKLQFSVTHFKELSSFGISILGSKILTYFNQNTDNLLIGYFLGEVALGYYAVAYRILQALIQLLVNTGNQVALPVLSKMQTEPQKLLRVFYQMTKYVSLIALPVFLGVVSLSNELVIVLFGEKWQSAIPVMQVLSLGGIVYLILFFNRSVFVAIGKPFWRLRLEVVNVVFNTFACIIAVNYGILAVGIAYVISDFLMIPLSLWVLKKLMKISLLSYLKQYISPIVCASLMMVSILISKYWIVAEPQIVLIVCTLLGMVVYAACLQLLNPALSHEIREVFFMAISKTKRKNF